MSSTRSHQTGQVYAIKARVPDESKQKKSILSWLPFFFTPKRRNVHKTSTVLQEGTVNLFNGAHNLAIDNSAFIVNIGCNTGRPLSGISLVDAAGKEYTLPAEFGISIDVFTKAIGLLMEGNAMEARIQREFIKQQMYSLAIERGDQTVIVNTQAEWASQVQSGTRITMSVILLSAMDDPSRAYRCPRCNAWNTPSIMEDEHSSSADCRGCYGRFQVQEAAEDLHQRLDSEIRVMVDDREDIRMLRNFCLQQYDLPQAATARRPLNVSAPLAFLDLVKFQFQHRPEIYNAFLDIMKDFKEERCDTPGVIDQVCRLFDGRSRLSRGFSTFLPINYAISDSGTWIQM